ncbi:MAG: TonB-dependent receptor [Rhodoferax sp.]|nr:TonB-dependent receptor [Rhodoferax sp.]
MKPSLNATRRASTGYQAGALALGLVFFCPWVGAQVTPTVSEKDYLAEVPIVLSVSRLPQRLDETPGAMTLIDRDFILRSGARDVVDVLRLVPGFQTSNAFESDAPQANYHGSFGVYSARIQVLIDGRSVYSTYLFGSVAPGLMSVALDDIERIEVFRGSNSAAYGARAMLGVVNIVTRSASDSRGIRVGINHGENGIQDAQMSLGWGALGAAMRLSVDQRSDDSLTGSNGHNRVQRANFKAELPVAADTQLELRTGWMQVAVGRGFATNFNAPLRETGYNSQFLQLDWKKTVNSNQDISLGFAHMRESFVDLAPYALAPVDLDYSGVASNDSLKFEAMRRLSSDLRYVWGAEWRRESVTSRPIYNTPDAIITDFTRLFTNVEWHLTRDVLLNAGGMVERSSASASSLAPRLMVNWNAAPGHTLRAGVARAFRPPSVFEKQGDIRYSAAGQLLLVTTLARGQVQAESVLTRELGYLAELGWLHSQLDVRVYDEAMSGFIQSQTYALPVGSSLLPSNPRDYFNGDSFSIRGVELQWQARPWQGARLGLTFEKSRIVEAAPLLFDPDLLAAVPRSAYTVSWLQQLPDGWHFAVNQRYLEAVTLPSTGNWRGSLSRTDLRLAKSARWGAYRGEIALTVQNAGGALLDYGKNFSFPKQAFMTLRLQH